MEADIELFLASVSLEPNSGAEYNNLVKIRMNQTDNKIDSNSSYTQKKEKKPTRRTHIKNNRYM